MDVFSFSLCAVAQETPGGKQKMTCLVADGSIRSFVLCGTVPFLATLKIRSLDGKANIKQMVCVLL